MLINIKANPYWQKTQKGAEYYRVATDHGMYSILKPEIAAALYAGYAYSVALCGKAIIKARQLGPYTLPSPAAPKDGMADCSGCNTNMLYLKPSVPVLMDITVYGRTIPPDLGFDRWFEWVHTNIGTLYIEDKNLASILKEGHYAVSYYRETGLIVNVLAENYSGTDIDRYLGIAMHEIGIVRGAVLANTPTICRIFGCDLYYHNKCRFCFATTAGDMEGIASQILAGLLGLAPRDK